MLANQAIKVIDDTKQSTVAQNKLKKAISIDPDNSNASYWKEILSYISIRYNFIVLSYGNLVLTIFGM